MSDEISIFECRDYKDYLAKRLGGKQQRRGIKSALAVALGIKPTYISQVLHGSANLSLEQAEAVNLFFSHTDDESQMLLLLVQRERAGTHTLKIHFQKQIDVLVANRLRLTQRLGKNFVIDDETRAEFYSSWQYLAAQIAFTVPRFQSRSSLAQALGISPTRAAEVIDFLIQAGLVQQNASEYVATQSQIRLGEDSPHLAKHHFNWRIKAMESLERKNDLDFHYSGVLSLSQSDVLKIKDLLLEQLKKNLKVVAESKEEKIYVMNLDFFDLEKP